ncbi:MULTISPECIES: hypothetical protein [Clostridia]|uniref:hypothetical protein n=1 Tax=Clostridia TaxID=186801 RepID=UPI000EA00B13|nr:MULTISPECIES: hypothetical protein [Clostridia]NBJ68304.1 hypothetical protein [Roseburia sp. 1XD42-34]RKI81396.1 hypothetical protein D7V87_02275 [Clostridium sp. 1xD42-85]
MHAKKIRGWKRRIKQLETWKKDSYFLDINSLRMYGVEYRKIFNFDERYCIPDWFKREVVLSFIDVFKRWETQAKDEFEEFYMCLHINETDIFASEIIIVITDAIKVYKSKFKKVENYKPRPDWIITFDNRKWNPYYLYSVWLEDEVNSLSDADKRKLMQHLVRVDKNKVNSSALKEYIIRDSIFWCLDINYA